MRATPSAMSSGVPAAPVLLGHGDQLAVGPGPRRPAGVGEQHQRQQPRHLAVVGQQPVDHAGQPDRLGRQLAAVQARPRGAGVALVEDQVEHVEDGAEPFAALAAGGMANGMPLSLMRCLARLMRRVMVASGTRNARAISAVVRPPTARRVSAICDAGDRTGWQHMNSRMSVSSASAAGRSAAGASHCSGRVHRAAPSSRRWRACSLRSRSVSRARRP